MRKSALLLGLVFIISGCASMTAMRMTSQNRENLSRLQVGMPRATVISIMGRCPMTVSCPQGPDKPAKQATIANPYRTETIQINDRKIEIVYYVLNIAEDCTVSEDSLLPMVFEDRKLIGWGKDFVIDVKK
ncbi:MAG: DUF3192 domain-containing protein [Candidatus Omnitrophica bacterium]|nr:DUF3192 domain-containing protein [Candidatus Omnitrophota bacterium]